VADHGIASAARLFANPIRSVAKPLAAMPPARGRACHKFPLQTRRAAADRSRGRLRHECCETAIP